MYRTQDEPINGMQYRTCEQGALPLKQLEGAGEGEAETLTNHKMQEAYGGTNHVRIDGTMATTKRQF